MNPPRARDLALGPDMTAQQLLRRSRQLLWMTLLPLLGLVIMLAAWQAWSQWRHALASVAAEARTQRLAFEVIARDANQHVVDLRHWMQQEFLRSEGAAAPAVAQALRPRRDAQGHADGYTLDELSPLLANGMAQLMWPQAQGQPPPAVLRQAQTLSATIELAHQRNPDLVWSYFFGWPDRHLVLFPWAPTRSIVEDQGGKSLSSVIDAWYRYEVFTGSKPEANPLRQPYWTAPYVDAGGQGLMVSHAVPVYSAGELRGMVGTDIKLNSLERLLDRLPGAPWQAWVIDDRGHVLADRQRPVAAAAPAASAASGTAAVTVRAADRLPPALDMARISADAAGAQQAVAMAGHRVVALRIEGAPWTLVLAAPARALAVSTLPEVLPYTVIALGLLAVWVVGQGLLRQRLLNPLLALLGYLQRLSEDAHAPEPHLGERWRPWVGRLRRAFDDMRNAARRERRADLLKSAIVDHAQAAVVVADDAGRIVEFNPSAEAMLGFTREQAIGQTLRELLTPERFRKSLDKGLQAMRRGEGQHLMGQRLQRVCLCADGRELPVETVVWMTEVDAAVYYTASMTDQTAARAAAEVIERQRDALRQSEKLSAMGGLLAGVAHELNNPLAIVMGRASLLYEKTEGTALASDAVRIRDAAERCGRIVRTFLNMARQRPAQRDPVRVNDLVRGVADMLGYTLRSHGIELELRLQDDLHDPLADGDQIGQVVINLIVNAQQALATHEGPRRIVVASGGRRSVGGAADEPVWVRVTDSGPGVPEALRGKVFEPFFTTKAEGIGTGIGLAVSRAIVREHGGELAIEPERAGQGASFLLTLPPVAAPPVVDDADVSHPAGAAGWTDPAPPPAEAARVLVVDDEPEFADLVRAVLESAGHEVATADSAAVALAMLDVAQFDAIVTDLRMPEMDGGGLWREVRQRHPRLARRVVFLTGDTLSPGSRQFLDETNCGRLEKPFARADLLTQVQRALNADTADA